MRVEGLEPSRALRPNGFSYPSSLKHELIYPGDFATGLDLFPALEDYFHFYNHHRPHQALGYHTPADLFPHTSKRKRSFS